MKVTVVMCTYNGEKYLDQQIQSILNQTRQPDAFLVFDDRSSDGTVAILERYQQAGKLRFHINQTQLGLIDNFKKATAMADADSYVALSDQDDEWMPDKLAKSLALMETLNQDVPCLVHTDLILVDESDKILNRSFRNELGQSNFQHNLQSLLYGNFVTGCTIVMNPVLKPFFTDMPSNVKFHDAWLALAAFTFGEVGEITEPMIRYRKHGLNLSIAANTKPRNRYRSTLDQLLKAFSGKDDFLALQFQNIGLFYGQYKLQIAQDKKTYFEQFLELENKPYLIKKIAFRTMIKRFPPKP